jgi:hypothetical protein
MLIVCTIPFKISILGCNESERATSIGNTALVHKVRRCQVVIHAVAITTPYLSLFERQDISRRTSSSVKGAPGRPAYKDYRFVLRAFLAISPRLPLPPRNTYLITLLSRIPTVECTRQSRGIHFLFPSATSRLGDPDPRLYHSSFSVSPNGRGTTSLPRLMSFSVFLPWNCPLFITEQRQGFRRYDSLSPSPSRALSLSLSLSLSHTHAL